MGCHFSRTTSTEDIRKSVDKTPETVVKKPSANRAPTQELRSANNGNALQIAGKPIIEVESASQADFFRMLDDKINRGKGGESDSEN
uniref:Small membrane A-kinase anchor protein n=1 Tax=Caenorhabditis tropicalis TaxID=1561998 RepID=A0A1I7UQ89_9PELO